MKEQADTFCVRPVLFFDFRALPEYRGYEKDENPFSEYLDL